MGAAPVTSVCCCNIIRTFYDKMPTLRRYQSTVMGSFQTVELIETFINYQESIKRCIALVVDPASYASGTPALKVQACRGLLSRIHHTRPRGSHKRTAAARSVGRLSHVMQAHARALRGLPLHASSSHWV
jgi:hypothetical protein